MRTGESYLLRFDGLTLQQLAIKLAEDIERVSPTPRRVMSTTFHDRGAIAIDVYATGTPNTRVFGSVVATRAAYKADSVPVDVYIHYDNTGCHSHFTLHAED